MYGAGGVVVPGHPVEALARRLPPARYVTSKGEQMTIRVSCAGDRITRGQLSVDYLGLLGARGVSG